MFLLKHFGYNEIMNSDEYYNFEDRVYTSPTVSRDDQLAFVDTLRDTMGRENQRIATQTQALGTNVQPSLGGLTGSEGYFQQRYQTPQMETTVNQLKATAQAKALNDLMSNYEAQAKNRYSQAYRNAKRRASTSGSGGTSGGGDGEEGGVVFEDVEGRIVIPSENDVVVSESTATDINPTGALTGGGTLPTTGSTGYYYVLNGDTTALRVYPGQGLETPITSYNKATGRSFVDDIVRRGGRIYNQYGKDITSLTNLYWGF